jgi:hypothetical protein
MAKTTAKKQLAFTANTELAPMKGLAVEQPFPRHFCKQVSQRRWFRFWKFLLLKIPGAAQTANGWV